MLQLSSIYDQRDRQEMEINQQPWKYYSAVLSDNARNTILNVVRKHIGDIPDGWIIICHHMTYVYNDGSPERNEYASQVEQYLGNKVGLFVHSIGISDNAIAVGVNSPSWNDKPHITVAVSPGTKPVESNNIKNWMEIEPFFVSAKVSVFTGI